VSRSETALLALAESIADGTTIDWQTVEAAAATPEERGVIRQLRVLSDLAGLHRSMPAPSDATTFHARKTAASPAIGSWAHLTLIERLGGGTFGDVYRAWDRYLEREVALKLLRAERSDVDLTTSRIANEGRLLARVRHANVVTVHGVAVHDQRVGLWMELVRGVTLEQQLLGGGPLSAREAAAIGVDLCRALAAIHGAGLIHRDVKAQNVMREDGGRIVLMDLGTGRDAGAHLTRGVPELAGTPLYLAPEIFTGSPASPRTDIYSLGVLLYHLVTGSFPVKAGSIDELQARHAGGSVVHLRDARADLPTAFVRVIDRAVAADPATRYEGAGALEADLADAMGEIAAPRHAAGAAPHAIWSRLTSAPGLAIGGVALLLLLALAVPAMRSVFAPRPAFTPRDGILVADFTNQTGESLFDGTLKDALTIELQQSPFVNAFRSTAPAAAAGDPAAAAREQCRSERLKAMVLGTIASTGSGYHLTVEARDCATDRPLADASADAPDRRGVLNALGVATGALRGRLGESPKSIQQFNVTVEAATTASLDALKAFSIGVDTRARIGEAEAIPYFNHALELDPTFALAEGRLGAIYANLREFEQSRVHTQRAFELSDHVTERERLYLRGSYHHHVTGQFDEAVGAYRLWTQLYPQDWMPYHNLGFLARRVGQFDEAVAEVTKARDLNPDQVIPYEELAKNYIAMGRFADARTTIAAAEARGLNAATNRSLRVLLALVDGGRDAMRQELAAMPSAAVDYVVEAAAARGEAFGGDFPASRALIARAVAKAQGAKIDDFASSLIAEDAVNAALAGDSSYAQTAVARALAVSRGSDALWSAALASALAGQPAAAGQLSAEYLRVTPPTTDVIAVFNPVLVAAAAIAGRNYQGALDALQSAVPYDRIGRFWPAYLRGQAYLGLQKPADAAREFETIADHRGDDPASVVYAVAPLYAARAYRAAGDTARARTAYTAFITAWSVPDPDPPLVAVAERELASLRP
jgi:eukaryotic-like serine/threonine-protein kinase